MAAIRPFLSARRLAPLVAALTVLAACGDDCTTPCQKGITFYVSELAGSLAAGSSEQLTLCFDGDCQQVTLSRGDVGGTKFVPFGSFGSGGDHTVTLTGPGSLSGSFQGAIPVLDQSGGGGCPTCAMGVVKVSADGTLTPGQVAPTQSTASATSTTSGG
jgi:hypothetical protein